MSPAVSSPPLPKAPATIGRKPSGLSVFRPIAVGMLGLMAINAAFTLLITFSPLNRDWNLRYGNYLPTKLEELQKLQPQTPNVLFLGTSQTHNGFIPAVFEREIAHGRQEPILSFNMGLPNNRYDLMLAYLRLHERKYGKPRLLLVELSPSIQERDASQYYLPALYYRTLLEQEPGLAPVWLANPLMSDNVRQELFLSLLGGFHQFRLTFSPFNLLRKIGGKLERHSASSSNLAGEGEAGETGTGEAGESPAAFSREMSRIPPDWLAQGWSPREKSPNMRTPEGVRRSVVEAERYYIRSQTRVSFDKLEALLGYCRQRQISVVLVTWPNHPAYLKVFQQSRLNAAYRQGLAELLKREHAPIVDLNSPGPEQTEKNPEQAFSKPSRDALFQTVSPVRWETFFADPRHLTPEGAAFCSAGLARRLALLPDTRKKLITGPNFGSARK